MLEQIDNKDAWTEIMNTGCLQIEESRHGLVLYKAKDSYIIYMQKHSPLAATYDYLPPCFKTDSKGIAQELFYSLESIEKEAYHDQSNSKRKMMESFYSLR